MMDAIDRIREAARNEATCIELNRQNKELRASLANLQDDINAVLKQRDDLHFRVARIEKALDVIQFGFEYINGDPKMDGTFEQHPHLINRQRMMEIAREALWDE